MVTENAVGDTSTGLHTIDRRARARSLRAALFGNLLEWFDWTLYATFTVYIAANFFEATDPTSALLSTLAVFAVGFIARPIGGLVFGRLGDRIGRKRTMILTMSLMAGASLAIALLPTYASVGALASMLLVVARLLQGLAHGGESGISYTYVAEIAPDARRGLWSSTVIISVTVGTTLATLTALLLTSLFPPSQMEAFGWRIGFAIGALLGIYAFYLRRAAKESPVFDHEHDAAEGAPRPRLSARAIVRLVATLIFMQSGANIAYYTWVTFAPAFAVSQHGMDPTGAYVASSLALVGVLFVMPFYGWLSDKIGRRPMLFTYGLAMAIVVFPIQWVVTSQPWTLFVGQTIGLLVWAMASTIFAATAAEQLPTRFRSFGIGFISSLSVALFGGTAPYLNAWLSSVGFSWVFSVWLAFLGLLAVAASFMIREGAGKSLQELDREFNKAVS